jgi:hypothetical protein
MEEDIEFIRKSKIQLEQLSNISRNLYNIYLMLDNYNYRKKYKTYYCDRDTFCNDMDIISSEMHYIKEQSR